MRTLQDLLNEFSKSELGRARADKLVIISTRKKVYEYNSKGQVIRSHPSSDQLREQGIRIDKQRDSIITEDGRIFSYKEEFPDFQKWYKKRNQQLSRKLKQLTPDGKFVRKWNSLLEIEKEIGVPRGNLKRYLKQGGINKFGKKRTVGGFVWEEFHDY